jgi:hypothetical protein
MQQLDSKFILRYTSKICLKKTYMRVRAHTKLESNNLQRHTKRHLERHVLVEVSTDDSEEQKKIQRNACNIK